MTPRLPGSSEPRRNFFSRLPGIRDQNSPVRTSNLPEASGSSSSSSGQVGRMVQQGRSKAAALRAVITPSGRREQQVRDHLLLALQHVLDRDVRTFFGHAQELPESIRNSFTDETWSDQAVKHHNSLTNASVGNLGQANEEAKAFIKNMLNGLTELEKSRAIEIAKHFIPQGKDVTNMTALLDQHADAIIAAAVSHDSRKKQTSAQRHPVLDAKFAAAEMAIHKEFIRNLEVEIKKLIES